MLDKLASGEYLIGYFVSGPVILPQMAQLDKVVGWNLISTPPAFLRAWHNREMSAPEYRQAHARLHSVRRGPGQYRRRRIHAYRAGVTGPSGGPPTRASWPTWQGQRVVIG